MTPQVAYEKLCDRFAQMKKLGYASEILGKDAESIMAKGSEDDRTEIQISLARAIHALISAPDLKDLFELAEKSTLDANHARNFELMRRTWVHAGGLPEELASELARIDSEGSRLHTEHGKYRGDWSKMRDWYKHTFDTMRRVAEIKKEKLGTETLYDALLDSFSPGMTDAKISTLFDPLKKYLPSMIAEALEKEKSAPTPLIPEGPFPKEQQEELQRRILTALGYDFNRGKLFMIDGHPSMGGSPDDARMTTNFREDDFLDSLSSAIHEAGHAIYEQNTPKEWRYMAAGGTMGMAVHESQSRIMEVQICHTPEFFQYLEFEARDIFNRPDDPALDAKNLERIINKPAAGFIRIESDELTYACHVILRHKIERDMIEGRITIDDVPRLWDENLKSLLGITPPDLSKGCLQDVHWPAGLVGYFPAYTLGDMGAAQLYQAACKKHPEIPSQIAKGDFKTFKNWLTENIHAKGSLLTMDELFIQATGEALNPYTLLNHLSKRFLGRPFDTAKAKAESSLVIPLKNGI